tara:strand:+ start:271 stop:648 length:378 start_codon:yes stop_codon:yes gene_type:complete
MAQFNIHVNKKDVNKFNRTMFVLKTFAKKDFIKSAQDTASNIVFLAKNRVPVDTGALRQSISVGGDKIGGELFSVFVDASMDYAGYVEFGTQRQRPQPYFFNSVRDGIKNFNRDIKLKLKKISTR